MTPKPEQCERLIESCDGLIKEMYGQCVERAPNFGVSLECFRESIAFGIDKFLFRTASDPVSADEIEAYLKSIQVDDLFLSIACSEGNERAWWEFDQNHRAYLERVSRHLASTEVNAQEAVDRVYVELYGTRIVDGKRVSKFASYSGKGSLRGWLRTVIWHSLVDLHRASHDEFSLDEMTENVGEGHVHSTFADSDLGGEDRLIDEISRERYREAIVKSIETAFSSLDGHEKLLLLYYHSENLTLREIARLVENPDSPLRNWFQRRSAARTEDPTSRIYESTVMRWLEKTYKKVLKSFNDTLLNQFQLEPGEIGICLDLATKDLANPDIYLYLKTDLNTF